MTTKINTNQPDTNQPDTNQPDTNQPDTNQPWEQQPDETSASYAAAHYYFGLGPQRRLKHVAAHLGKSKGYIGHLSTKHHWVERAKAYDQYLARIEQRAKEEVLHEQATHDAQTWVQRTYQKRERLWAVSEQLLERAEEMLAAPLEDMRWTPRDIATLSDLSIRMAQHVEQSLPTQTQASDATDNIEILVRYVGQ